MYERKIGGEGGRGESERRRASNIEQAKEISCERAGSCATDRDTPPTPPLRGEISTFPEVDTEDHNKMIKEIQI